MRRRTRNIYKSGFKNIIINNIRENAKTYFNVLIVFIIGICVGVYIINKLPEAQTQNISQYINTSIESIKNNSMNSEQNIFRQSIIKNLIIVALIWLFGLTFLGNYILYIITFIIGLSFGYTLSGVMTALTLWQGIIFFFTSMILQNVIAIPAIIFLIVQGIQCREDFVKEKNVTLKHILIKYTVYTLLVFAILFVSSLIEAHVSSKLLKWAIKYI